jgi:hypothetical protein
MSADRGTQRGVEPRLKEMFGGKFMRSRTTRFVVSGIVAVAVIVIAVVMLRRWSFEQRWATIDPGMTEVEVKEALGNPTWKGTIDVQGAGGKSVTSWRYERGRWTYSVDYDYTGPNGSPETFRRRKDYQEWYWEWPSWWPWRAAKAKA